MSCKYRSGTNGVQGISFAKGSGKFKGSETDRSMSFASLSKLNAAPTAVRNLSEDEPTMDDALLYPKKKKKGKNLHQPIRIMLNTKFKIMNEQKYKEKIAGRGQILEEVVARIESLENREYPDFRDARQIVGRLFQTSAIT
ncbi:MAG: hypothetical protein ACTHMI_04140 [Mucilaginibacter sp.]